LRFAGNATTTRRGGTIPEGASRRTKARAADLWRYTHLVAISNGRRWQCNSDNVPHVRPYFTDTSEGIGKLHILRIRSLE